MLWDQNLRNPNSSSFPYCYLLVIPSPAPQFCKPKRLRHGFPITGSDSVLSSKTLLKAGLITQSGCQKILNHFFFPHSPSLIHSCPSSSRKYSLRISIKNPSFQRYFLIPIVYQATERSCAPSQYSSSHIRPPGVVLTLTLLHRNSHTTGNGAYSVTLRHYHLHKP